MLGKKSDKALYPKYHETVPKPSNFLKKTSTHQYCTLTNLIEKSKNYFNAFWTSNPATTPIVVGKLAAQTPSFFNVFSSISEATTNGGAH